MELVDPVLLHIHAYEVSLTRGDPTTLLYSSLSKQLALREHRGTTSSFNRQASPTQASFMQAFFIQASPNRLCYQGGPMVTSPINYFRHNWVETSPIDLLRGY